MRRSVLSACVPVSAAVWLVLAFANWVWVFRNAVHARGILLMLLALGAVAGVAAGVASSAIWLVLNARARSRLADPVWFGLTCAVALPVSLWCGLWLADLLLEQGVRNAVAILALGAVMSAGLFASSMLALRLEQRLPGATGRGRLVLRFAALLCIALGAALAAGLHLPGNSGPLDGSGPGAGGVPPPREGSPDIILISLDTVRPDHLSALGYERPTSPNVDGLIRSGTVFTQTIASSSWTVLSHATLFTGASPSRIGPEMLEPQDSGRLYLPETSRTMAEILRENGYLTAAFIGGATMRSNFGFGQGFDLFDDMLPPSLQMNMDSVLFAPKIRKLLSIDRSEFLAGLDPLFLAVCNRLYGQGHAPPLPNFLARSKYPKRFWNSAEEVNHKVARHLREHPRVPGRPDRPRFLFVHYFDAHSPYDAPAPFGGRWASDPTGLGYQVSNALIEEAFQKGIAPDSEEDRILTGKYDEEIALVDQGVGRLMAMVKEAGLLENALVILFSDHGESLGEHGDLFHGHSLHEELVRILFAVSSPGRVPEGLRVDRQVRAVDILPTILQLAGLDPRQADPGTEGESLVPLLTGAGSRQLDPPAFSELYAGGIDIAGIRRFAEDYLSIRKEGWKLVLVSGGRRRLYDLGSDPMARRDLASAEPGRAARMEAELRAWRSQGFSRGQEGESDPRRLEELRGLGYISQSR